MVALCDALAAQAEAALAAMQSKTAIFLAELLVTETPSGPAADPARHLLARCHLATNDLFSAASVLRGTTTPACQYLHARILFALHRLQEAESLLTAGRHMDDLLGHAAAVPGGAAGLALLGLICCRTTRSLQAAEYLKHALALDPFQWEAYAQLCELGAAPEPSAIFSAAALDRLRAHRPQQPQRTVQSTVQLPLSTPAALQQAEAPITATPGADQPVNLFKTPQVRPMFDLPPSAAPLPSANTSLLYATPSPSTQVAPTPPAVRGRKQGRQAPARQPPAVRPTKRAGGLLGRQDPFLSDDDASPHPLARQQMIPLPQISEPERRSENPASQGDGEMEVLGLLSSYGAAYRLICLNRASDALQAISRLPAAHQKSGWALSLSGRAHTEMYAYVLAGDTYEEMHRLFPHRYEGLDLYSTVLWQQKKQHQLSFLAQSLAEQRWMVPETWVVAGNAFSLQKDRDTAIKLFQRAIQFNTNYHYAFTLAGHEHVACDDYERAQTAFRKAIAIDERQYKAWYGLGVVALRQDAFVEAEIHFRRALSICDTSVLWCYLGMALHSQQRHQEALDAFDQAIARDKLNPLPALHKAQVLIDLSQLEEAMVLLDALRDSAPREATLHLLLGSIYTALDRVDEALASLMTASDLDPKSPVIKAALDDCCERYAELAAETPDRSSAGEPEN
eukprot:TRINITY_DN10531_c0_g1_i1.p1 TRINITY_DN10531_c0_g1~~TRINITY_DN10531_c0_g1_i1.p1  ORF type:complete len:679 (+),score=120.31 TRINITY_DN10531_c0_g1_i1:3-2039(+)